MHGGTPRARLVLETGDDRDVRPAELRRDADAGHGVGVIGGQGAGEHHVRALATGDGGDEFRDGRRPGAGQRIVPDANRAFAALRQAAAQRFLGLLRSDGHRHHLDAAVRLHDLQRGLVGIVVPFVGLVIDEVGIGVQAVVAQFEVLVQNRHLLYGYQYLHDSRSGLVVELEWSATAGGRCGRRRRISARSAANRTCGSGSSMRPSRSSSVSAGCSASMTRFSG